MFLDYQGGWTPYINNMLLGHFLGVVYPLFFYWAVWFIVLQDSLCSAHKYCGSLLSLCGFPSTLLIIFFEKSKFLISMSSSLPIFSFPVTSFYGPLKKSCIIQKWRKCFPTLASESYMVLPFTFRCMIYLELIWGCDRK